MMKKLTIVVVALLAGLLVVAGTLFVLARLKPVMGEEARRSAPGSFVRLSHGVVHYLDEGPPSGEPLLLIHGSTVPAVIWDKTVGSLNAAGYRTIRADLYGRGYSDRPRIKYDYDVFARQNLELLDSLGITGSFHIGGISLGGAIAVVATGMVPQRVASLLLVDPAGPFLDDTGAEERLMRLSRWARAVMEEDSPQASLRREQLAPLMEQVRTQMKYRGSEYVSISFMRNRNQHRLREAWQGVGRLPIPSLLVWGEDDPIIPVRFAQDVVALIPGIELHIIPGGGHAPHYEQPGVVNMLIVDFMQKVARGQGGQSAQTERNTSVER